MIGGNAAYSSDTSDFKGLNKAYTFNPFNETWTEQPDMRHGRWYPSAVRLPDGRMPILSGLDESGTFPTNFNTDVELFTPSSDLNGRGTMTLVGSRGGSGQPPKGGNYPHMFSMPSGRMLVAGPFPGDTWFMDPPGSSSFTWTDVPNMPADRLWGTAVLMPGGTAGSTRVMELGGSKPATITSTTTDLAVATTEVFDESAQGAGWQSAPSMNVGRGHHNTVLLPDGSMATVGGGVGIRDGDQWEADEEQKQIELWNPTTGQWRLGPAQAENRAYHSIAMLLPDGRVISAGDDVHGGIDQDTAEIYHGRLPLQGSAAHDHLGPGRRPHRHQLRGRHPGRQHHRRDAHRALRCNARRGHERALAVAQRESASGRGHAHRAGRRGDRPRRLLHALPAERSRHPVGREVDPPLSRRRAVGAA